MKTLKNAVVFMMTPWASERDLFVIIFWVYFVPFENFPALKFLSFFAPLFVLFLFFFIIQLSWCFFIIIYSLESENRFCDKERLHLLRTIFRLADYSSKSKVNGSQVDFSHNSKWNSNDFGLDFHCCWNVNSTHKNSIFLRTISDFLSKTTWSWLWELMKNED